MKRSSKSILLLLAIFLLCINSSAQVLESVVINDLVGVSNRALCDQVGGTDYSLDISFSGAAFADDNTFTIELSDENGSFSDPSNVKTLRTLISTDADNYNEQFNIENISFQLQEGTYGKNYVIRVTTSNPVQTVQTASFEAYYDMFTEGELSINNGNNFTLCNGETREVFLDTDVNREYLWYRRVDGIDELVVTTQEPKYTITETGQYFVVVDYGFCGGPKSKFLTVDGLSGADTQIKGASTIEICGDKSHTFEANVTNTSYTYNWYLDDELKQSSNDPTYETPTAGQFGTYRLEIVAGTCTTVSNDVVLQQQTDAGYTVTNEGALKRIILFGESKELCINHDATPVEDVTIEWFRNGQTLGTAVQDQLCIDATTAGTYFARVTKSTGSACDAVVDSEEFVLLAVDSLNVVIRTATDYEECNSATTKLSMVGVKAIAEDGNEYDLTSDQIAMLNFDWKKDGVSTGGTNEEYTVNSYADNGSYILTVSTNTGKSGDSNVIDVKLVDVPQVSSTSTSNSLCVGGSPIVYTIDNFNMSYTYQWIKDGDEDVTPSDPQTLVVTEVGEYVLQYSDSSCSNELAPINVIPFDDSAVTVTPSEIVVLEEGGSAIVVAAGGENYEWYQGEDTSGALLSTTEQLEVTELGFYTVQVKVGNCTLYKTIEVVEPDGQIIVPNIVSPNQDGINDTWKLSNSYAYQPSVEIILYNSGGKEILKTTDYKNDWPVESLGNQKIFYYKIIREGKLIKAGTISVID